MFPLNGRSLEITFTVPLKLFFLLKTRNTISYRVTLFLVTSSSDRGKQKIRFSEVNKMKWFALSKTVGTSVYLFLLVLLYIHGTTWTTEYLVLQVILYTWYSRYYLIHGTSGTTWIPGTPGTTVYLVLQVQLYTWYYRYHCIPGTPGITV